MLDESKPPKYLEPPTPLNVIAAVEVGPARYLNVRAVVLDEFIFTEKTIGVLTEL